MGSAGLAGAPAVALVRRRTIVPLEANRARATGHGAATGVGSPYPQKEIAMAPITRGFRRRREADVDPARLPPGQYATTDFPVLSAGPTPQTPLEEWRFALGGAVAQARSWTWDELLALPSESVTVDIHCVTKWSKFDT